MKLPAASGRGIKNHNKYLHEHDAFIGLFSKTSDPLFVEATGKAGFDFIILDSEHGLNSIREIYPLVMAAALNGIYPIVRVPKLEEISIQRIMDLGVAGIQIPQIRNKTDAELAVKYSRFHPKGLRGRCRYVRPAAFSLMEKEQYIQSQNDVTVIIQVEGVEGIKNFNAILEVEDLDIIFIGPYDLSQSMGIPGQVDHPDLLNEIEKLVNQCNDKGRFTGIFTDDIPTAMKYRELGVKYIAYSVDVGIFAQACKSAVDRFVE
jgi:4-hydroxy-2-oxoheptanedioate aldolase